MKASAAGVSFKEDINGNDTQLGSGTVPFYPDTWHRLNLFMKEDTIKAFVDSTLIVSVIDNSYSYGQIGILVSKWQNSEFDNISIVPTDNLGGLSVDDAVQGSGYNSFDYVGSGWQHCTACGTELYDQTNSWDNVAGDYASVKFRGTQIKFYGVKDPRHGIGAVSVDGGQETNIDFYASVRNGDQLMWTSPYLAEGDHVFKLRVTGTRNPSSSDSWVVPDKVVIFSSSSTGIEEQNIVPKGYYLYQNQPNPFNPTTIISYRLPASSRVNLKIYDILGRELETLVNKQQGPGEYKVRFNGDEFSSGIYFYEIHAVGEDGQIFGSVKKMILIK